MTVPFSCNWLTARGKAVFGLLRHTPLGPAWLAFRTPGKTFARIWQSLARSLDDIDVAMCRLAQELDPRSTQELIGEWETAVGLPDLCLPTAATLDERRAWVLWRLAKRRWTTAQDWMDLAALFGMEIAVTPGWYVQRPALFGDLTPPFAEFEFPLRFDLFPKLGRFRVYIDVVNVSYAGFEYGSLGANADVGFPIPFGAQDERFDLLKCIIDRVRPANVVVIWNEYPEVGPTACTRRTFDPAVFGTPFC